MLLLLLFEVEGVEFVDPGVDVVVVVPGFELLLLLVFAENGAGFIALAKGFARGIPKDDELPSRPSPEEEVVNDDDDDDGG